MDLIGAEEWQEIEDGISSTTSSKSSSTRKAALKDANDDTSSGGEDEDTEMSDTEEHEEQTMGHVDVDGRTMIQQLERIERALVKLLEISADSLDLISTPAAAEEESQEMRLQKFRQISRAYFQLLDKIQHGLRSSVHSMTLAGLLRLTAGTGSVYHIPRRQDLESIIQKHEHLLLKNHVDINQYL